MKKNIILTVLLFSLISAVKPTVAGATITGMTLQYFEDSVLGSHCTLPETNYVYMQVLLSGSVNYLDSLTIKINFDDGSDTVYRTGVDTGSIPYYYCNFPHTYTMPGTYTASIIIIAATFSDTFLSNTFTLSDTCATLTGVLYVDTLGSCVKVPGEVGISYVPILVVNNSTHDTTWGNWTNDTGYYSVVLLSGINYTIIPDPSVLGWWWTGYTYDTSILPSCPVSGIYTITPSGGGSYTKDFAYACTPPDSFDVSARGWNWSCIVPGDTSWIMVWTGNWDWYTDYTCASVATTITLTLDPHLTYAGYDPSYSGAPTVSGSAVTWNYATSGDEFGFVAMVKVAVSTSLAIGDSVCNTVYASPTALPDPNLANNTASFCHVVTSSYDPNSKEVSPQGAGSQGYIPNNTPLSYLVNFQNTGTAPAANITITDTLSPELDVKTLHVLKSSAPVQIYTSGNVVKFRFDNINLPDSASNPVASTGFVSYGILPRLGLAPGTQVWNKADIYFDYNPPVVTNSTLNTIEGIPSLGAPKATAQNSRAIVYPNPAGNLVYAKISDNSDFSVVISDVLGRTTASSKSVNGLAQLYTENLPEGLYIVKLTNSINQVITTKVMIQH